MCYSLVNEPLCLLDLPGQSQACRTGGSDERAERADEFLVAAPLDEDAPRGHAGLAMVQRGAEPGCPRRHADIAVFQDEESIATR